ncbi:MAG TPA: trypsin-like peptidase domain-containing protein [Thermomicrobiaceae bacterium]|nr:trypsin-like peptidase domain-containing protein [Thermomicrobiaceae bacterium]
MAFQDALQHVDPLATELSRVADRIRASVVSIQSRSGGGAGVIWSADGLVVTNDHVVGDERVRVVLADRGQLPGTVVGRDRQNDLAAVRIERTGLPAAPHRDEFSLRVGELVLAVGHPFGIEYALTAGIVSGLPDPRIDRPMIRADLSLNPGNSGGPLTDATGSVLGINAMVAGPGVALAVPTSIVRAFVARTAGSVPRLGLTAVPVTLSAPYQRLVGPGAALGLVVSAIEPGSAAAAAGLLLGDVIVSAGGSPLSSPRRLPDAVALSGAGGVLGLALIRGGALLDVAVALRTPAVADGEAEQRAA